MSNMMLGLAQRGQPTLGGSSGPDGGSGGPPGGFIGQLSQQYVCYDTTEAASTSGSSSLLDNLNHIRYDIQNLETTGYVINSSGSSTDNAIAKFDGTSGSRIQNTGIIIIDDSDNVSGIGTLDTTGRITPTAITEQLRLAYDADSYVSFTSGSASTLTITPAETGGIILRPTTDSTTFFQILDADGGTPILNVDAVNERVGIGTTGPTGKLHVDQSSATGAIPVLILDQGDDDQNMIQFIGTIGVGNCIEAVGAKTLTTTHFIKVLLPGSLVRYIPVGTIA